MVVVRVNIYGHTTIGMIGLPVEVSTLRKASPQDDFSKIRLFTNGFAIWLIRKGAVLQKSL